MVLQIQDFFLTVIRNLLKKKLYESAEKLNFNVDAICENKINTFLVKFAVK